MKISLGYMTASSKTEAREIVAELFAQELIACANIFEGVESHYVWEDQVAQEDEVVVIFKTRSRNEAKIIQVIKAMHSYECPCIVFSSLEHGNPDFLHWIEQSC